MSTKSIEIIFAPGIYVYNSTKTDITEEDIYNDYNYCGDEIYDDDWTEYLKDQTVVDRIVASMRDKLDYFVSPSLDFILSKNYDTISEKLKSEGRLANYKMEKEGKLEIVKLLAYYRYSLFGRNIGSIYGYDTVNFIMDGKMAGDVCELLFNRDTIVSLGSPTCTLNYDAAGSLHISITVDDMSMIGIDSQIQFNDVMMMMYVGGDALPIEPPLLFASAFEYDTPLEAVIIMNSPLTT